MKDCARSMLKFTAWFMGIYIACWLLLWLSVPDITSNYEFQTFGQSLIVNRWFDLLFVAVHLNLILVGFFWIIPRLRKLDLNKDSDSSTAVGCGLLIIAIIGMVLVAKPALETCITGAIITSLLVFSVGIVTTEYLQSVLLSAGSAIMMTFIPGALGGGALNGLYAGLLVTLAVFVAGMLPYAIIKPIILKYAESKTPE